MVSLTESEIDAAIRESQKFRESPDDRVFAALIRAINESEGYPVLCDLAEELGMHPTTFSNALGRLVRDGRLEKARKGIYIPKR